MNKIKNLLSPKPHPTKQEKKFHPHPVIPFRAPNNPTKSLPANPARLLLIGAGSRGATLARSIVDATNGLLVSVADPSPDRRREIGRNYIWGASGPKDGQEFEGWRDFLEWEKSRRREQKEDPSSTDDGMSIDAVVISTPDKTHREIVAALAPLGLHIMCEKPLATSLDDCLDIARSLGVSLQPGEEGGYSGLFAIGHVMRYAPVNRMVRKMIVEDDAIGDVVSIEHTENVGWWHFAHSYVRGNWRNEDTSGPSLLTKSCHDIDFLMWLTCSPALDQPPHLPSTVTAFGSLTHFRRPRKPRKAGDATNCLSCPAEGTCHFSARKIYHELSLKAGLAGWPVNVVVPEIEDLLDEGGLKRAEDVLRERLEEDYTSETPKKIVDAKQWYGRFNRTDRETFHMTAFADGICVKRTKIYGTKGEIEINGCQVRLCDFRTGLPENPRMPVITGGHGGGDHGLMGQFVFAVEAVKNEGMDVQEAQNVYIGCTLGDIIRSHAMVFAAEEARKTRSVIDWDEWWDTHVLGSSGQ